MAMQHWKEDHSNGHEEIDDLISFANTELGISDELIGDTRIVSIDTTTSYAQNLLMYRNLISRVVGYMHESGVTVEEISPEGAWTRTYSVPTYLRLEPMSKRSSYINEEDISPFTVGAAFKNALNRVCDESELSYEETYQIVSPLFASYRDFDNTFKYIFLRV